MPLINELLHRVAQASRGQYGGSVDAIEQVQRWERPAAVRVWRAWAEATGAFTSGNLQKASQWLNSAEATAVDIRDDVLIGELDLLWARILNQADEPRRALPHAQAAWTCWFGLACNALQALQQGNLPAMLEALTYPQKLELPEQKLFMEWLTDRASPNLHHAAAQVFGACKSLQYGAPALAVATDLRAWYRTTSEAGHLPPARMAPLVADLLRDVGNLHDALGEPQVALDTFEEARTMLTVAGVDANPAELRLLDFNIANQQAKLGQHQAAITKFEQVAAAFIDAGDEEPALRAHHAALVSRWSLGETADQLLGPVEDLLLKYEALLARHDGQMCSSELEQNLHMGNRLWISLASRALCGAVSAERFLFHIFANREGNTRAHTVWHQISAGNHSPEVLNQMSVLLARLGRELASEPAQLLVLSLESGVDEVLVLTLLAGNFPLGQRLVVERLEPLCVQALEALITQRREATMAIAAHAIAATSPASVAFEAACSAFWQTLPMQTRERLAAASTVYFLPEPGGDLDETPLELAHDGQGYLGLRKHVLRAASWRQLAQALAPNRIDINPTGRFGVVRGADIPVLGKLQKADDEVAMVEALARKRFDSVTHMVEPTAKAFLTALDGGLDVLHFTGHSYADEAGEYLVLRTHETVGVPELMGLRSHAAPVSVFCSCLVGLHRSTRRGLARGIASALLDSGAPAVVAAMVPLPDQVGLDFALALHFHAQTRSLSEAVKAARITLASRFHPATWGCFALFGQHDARLGQRVERPLPSWPALMLRCLATRGTEWRQPLEAALRNASELSPALAQQVLDLVELYVAARQGGAAPTPFDAAQLRLLGADGHLALQAAADLATALCTPDESHARHLVSRALLAQEVTDDNYFLIAAVDTGIRRGLLSVQDEVSTDLIQRAQYLLNWLNRSAAGLSLPRAAILALREQWSKTITFKLEEIADVPPEVFQAADAGDRNAMKEMVWNLKSRDASHEALASEQPWMYWLYRWMGADSDAAMADFCGVVDGAARAGRMGKPQAEALRTLFKRYVGPGEIEPEHVKAALQAFAGDEREITAIRLFSLCDHITSQEREVLKAEIEQGQALAKQQGATGLVAFLELQLGDQALKRGELLAAREQAEAALKVYSELAQHDVAYTQRRNLAAAFLYNVAQSSGDAKFQAKVLKEHRAKIEAYMAEQ